MVGELGRLWQFSYTLPFYFEEPDFKQKLSNFNKILYSFGWMF